MNRKLASGWLLICLGLSMVTTGWMAGRAARAATTTIATTTTPTAAAVPVLEADDLIRVHIVANSDSAEDQHLKLQVRDAVLAELEPQVAGATSRAQAEAIIRAALPELVKAGSQVVAERGYEYEVRAELGRFSFPGKSYGEIYLPAGEYQALRVTIGKAEGANFWCLVYPSLCYNVREVQGIWGERIRICAFSPEDV